MFVHIPIYIINISTECLHTTALIQINLFWQLTNNYCIRLQLTKTLKRNIIRYILSKNTVNDVKQRYGCEKNLHDECPTPQHVNAKCDHGNDQDREVKQSLANLFCNRWYSVEYLLSIVLTQKFLGFIVVFRTYAGLVYVNNPIQGSFPLKKSVRND